MGMEREQLLEDEAAAWHALDEAISATLPERRASEGAVPGWSTHDLVWHSAYWATYATDRLERVHRGEHLPDEDSYLPDEAILAEGRTMSWEDAVRSLEGTRERARTALAAPGDVPADAMEEFLSETTQHYAEHAGHIRVFNAS